MDGAVAPVSPGSLARLAFRARSARTLSGRPLTRRTVLFVEDDPALLKAMSEHARRMGCEVAVASHFAAACAHLALRAPDLVCIDIGLPTESGYELCEFIRSRGLGFLPILVTSAFGSPVELAQAEDAGANSFLRKPFSMNRLGTHIDALIDGVWPRSACMIQLAILGARIRAVSPRRVAA